MPAASIEEQIRERIEQFVDELTQLVRESAMSAVSEALGESVGAPRARGGAARPRMERARGGRRSGGRRTGPELLAFVSANPGMRVDEIATAMGTTSKGLQPAIKQLLADGALTKEGQRRGTRYFMGSGEVGSAASAAPVRKKKRGKRKASRKKKRGARKTGA